MADFLDVIHALWIEWCADTLRTTALLALAGADEKKIQADPHAEFADLFSPGVAPTPHDPEERRALIARLAG
ncbi:hypothetical protein [Streptosporangium canum]|uniref:hypothetical protein n=1 Tax=Streptosporangium canum TaxID=324952 RepID=UPI0033B9CB6F